MKLCDLHSSMTSEVILFVMKNLCLDNVSIHINIYQNRLIHKYDRKNFVFCYEKFFVRCRRTYVLNKLTKPDNHGHWTSWKGILCRIFLTQTLYVEPNRYEVKGGKMRQTKLPLWRTMTPLPLKESTRY